MGGIKDMLSPHVKTWGGYITPIPPRIYALAKRTILKEFSGEHASILLSSAQQYLIYMHGRSGVVERERMGTAKGVFNVANLEGVQGVQTPPPPEIFRFFLKSGGKETERKRWMCGGRVTS